MSANGVTVVGAENPIHLADHVGTLGRDGACAVIAIPRALAQAGRTAVTIAVGAHPDVPVAWFVSDHGPLGLLAALSASRAQQEDPGRGLATVHAILEITWSAAVVSGVTRLPSPAPGVGQHLRSYLPGSTFLVRHRPEPAVTGTRSGLRPETLGLPATSASRVLVAGAGTPHAVIDAVQHAARAAAVRPFEMPGDWRSVYGVRGAHQLVLLPDVTSLRPATLGACPACGVGASAEVCPFCQVRCGGLA